VIGAWPSRPGPAETGNLDALAGLAPLRAVLPTGAGSVSAEEFAAMSKAAFNSDWVAGLV